MTVFRSVVLLPSSGSKCSPKIDIHRRNHTIQDTEWTGLHAFRASDKRYFIKWNHYVLQLSRYFPEFLINMLSFVYLPFNCIVQTEVFCFVTLPAFEGDSVSECHFSSILGSKCFPKIDIHRRNHTIQDTEWTGLHAFRASDKRYFNKWNHHVLQQCHELN